MLRGGNVGRVWQSSFLNALPYSLVLLGVALIVLAAFNSWALRSQAGSESVSTPAQSWTSTDLLLERLQERLRSRPADQEAYLTLGSAYLQKARETGDPSYYARGEEALLKALELDSNSVQTITLLGAVALGRHEFQKALEWAERSLEINPSYAEAYGVLGDAQVELGRYKAAFASFQRMVGLKPNLDSYARVSYARQLTGDVEGAVEAMQRAVASSRPETEGAAWARVQLGDLYFNSGRIDEASEQYEAALTDFNSYYPALAALGKARAAQSLYDEAIRFYEQSVAIIPQPTALAALGDLYARTGHSTQTKLQYDTVEFIGKLSALNQQLYNRELALFYADHDIKLAEALKLTTQEIKVRQDIYGYDALAWALFKNGRAKEAAEAIAEAMKLGTQDPSIYYHAGMIYYRLGGQQQARQYLQQALKLNPHFSIQQADEAKRTLEELSISPMPADMREGAMP
jgi:tetratricopeptide (TPR) repeat protein